MTNTSAGLSLTGFKTLCLLAFGCCLTGTIRAAGDHVPPCGGSLNVSRFRLLVEPANNGKPLPLQNINILEPGDKLKYEPLHIPPAIRDRAKIAILVVAVPKTDSADDSRKKPAEGEDEPVETRESIKAAMKEVKESLHVLEAQPAKDVHEWDIPARASVVGVVFGPTGLDVKRVSSMVIKNPDVIPQLTEYAEQTEKVGALVQALSEYQQEGDPSRDVNAALAGFASNYNIAIPRINTNLPPNQQAAVLMQAMMPSMQNLDPTASTSTALLEQGAGVAGAVATLFFGSPVGLAAGGAAFLLNLRTMVFPDTDIRTAFTQPFEVSGLSLCACNDPQKPRTRTAYLWMMKVPNVPAPPVSMAHTAYVPIGGKPTLKVHVAKEEQSNLLRRAHGWELVAGKNHADVPVEVKTAKPDDLVEMDLSQTKLPPGQYQLAALWDWEPMQVKGDVDLRPPGDLAKARVTQESEDHLVQGTGPVRVQLTGTDFEFVEKVSIAKAGDKKATPKDLVFELPKGREQGDQESLIAEVDTSELGAGSYRLVVTQSGAPPHDVALVIHPPNPTLDSLPWRANLGDAQQAVTLRGARLERITRITTPDAVWELAPTKSDTHDLKERKATVKLQAGAHRGEVSAASVYVQDIEAPLNVPGALDVDGPRPKIAGVSQSLSQQPDVHLDEGEIPTGAAVSFSLLTRNVDPHPVLSLACVNDGFTKTPLVLHPGDRTPTAQLDFAGDDGLFLSLDPGVVGQSGCHLAATISTETAGNSDPTVLGHVIRLPRIEKFVLSDEQLGTNLYAGILTGIDLQIIDKTGWDAKTGLPVQGIPTPVPGANPQEQTLKVELPWPPPSPHAPIYVWLRGESAGRLTTVKY